MILHSSWKVCGVAMAIAMGAVSSSLLPMAANADIVIRYGSSTEPTVPFVDDNSDRWSVYDGRSNDIRGYGTGRDRDYRHGGYSTSVDDSVLINPVLVNPRIDDSLLINPVIVSPSRFYRYSHSDRYPLDRSSDRPAGYRSGCLTLSARRAACQ